MPAFFISLESFCRSIPISFSSIRKLAPSAIRVSMYFRYFSKSTFISLSPWYTSAFPRPTVGRGFAGTPAFPA